MSLLSFLGYFLLFFQSLAFILATIILFKKGTDAKFRILYAVLFITFLIESLSLVLGYLNSNGVVDIANSYLLYNVYELFAFSLLFLLYYQLSTSLKRKFIPILWMLFLSAFLIEGYFLLDYTKTHEIYPFVVGSIGLSISVIFYFTKILEDGSIDLLVDNLYFWVSTGLLIYYVANIPFASVSNLAIFKQDDSFTFVIVWRILGVLMNVFICIGLYRHLKKR